MKKRLTSIFLVIGMFVGMFCSCEDTPVDPITGTPLSKSGTRYNLYWSELPTGKAYPAGDESYETAYNEFEYASMPVYEIIDGAVTLRAPRSTEKTTDIAFFSSDGKFSTPVYHWETEREYTISKTYKIEPGQDITEAMKNNQYGNDQLHCSNEQCTFMTFSSVTLDYNLIDFTYEGETLTDNQIQNISAVPGGGFAAFVIPVLQGLTREYEQYSFVLFDENGKNIKAIPLTEWKEKFYDFFEQFQNSAAGTVPVSTVAANCEYLVANDGIYFRGVNSVMVMSLDGEFLYTTALPGSSASVTLDAEGNAVCVYMDTIDGEKKYVYAHFDHTAKKLGDEEALPNGILTEPQFAPGYDAYWTTSIGVMAANLGEAPVTLLEWSDYDLPYPNIEQIRIVDADHIIFTLRDLISGEFKIGLLAVEDIEGREAQTTTQKETITLAYVASDTPENAKAIENYVSTFNMRNSKYRVKVVSYTSDGTLSPNNALIKDIVSGNIPDMILFDSDMAPEAFADLGIFVDLYDYMDMDAKYNRDAFVSCVLEPFENSKGELRYLTVNFGISSMAMLTENANGMTSWTLDEMAAYNASLGKDKYLMDAAARGNSSYDYASHLLKGMLPNIASDYIDYENGVNNFGGNLEALLELCKNSKVHLSMNGAFPEMYADGSVALVRFSASDMGGFLKVRHCRFSGGEVTYIGYPTEEKCGSTIVPMTSLAITTSCKNPEGAWEFIKSCLDDMHDEWTYDSSKDTLILEDGFSCVKATNELMFETLKHYYFNSIYRISPNDPNLILSGGSTSYDAMHFTADGEYLFADKRQAAQPGYYFYTVTDEDIEAFMEMLDSITMVYSFDTELRSIIYEDASYYFAGTKSLEETVKIINKRVQTRLSE